MADVWISRKRWTCKYCDVTINDDLPSRRHHESGLRHKQNVEKALQDLYRKGEQEHKDAEHMKEEMARIEALAAESYAKDQALVAPSTSTLLASSSSLQATSAVSSPRPKPPLVPVRRPAKAVGEPAKEAQQPIAQAGEWEEVQPVPSVQATSSYSTSRPNGTSDRDKARSFRMKEKVARLDDSDEDEAASTIKIKKRPRTDVSAESQQTDLSTSIKKEEPAASAGSVKSEADASSPQAQVNTTDTSISAMKGEEGESADAASVVKREGDDASGGGGGLFKKRRAGAGAGAKRVRAVI